MCPLGRRGARNGFSRSVLAPKHDTHTTRKTEDGSRVERTNEVRTQRTRVVSGHDTDASKGIVSRKVNNPLGRGSKCTPPPADVGAMRPTTLLPSSVYHMCPLGRRGARNGVSRLVVTPKHSALKHMCPLGRRGAQNWVFALGVYTKILCA